MIDGIKIELPSHTATSWLSNKLLNFYTSTNVDTGEMLDNTTIAKYRGLVFYIIQSTKYEGLYYCEIAGSLHKYFNSGKHNYNDFTFNDLQSVINDLSKKFNINPETAILRNIEFGVNIFTPLTSSELLKNLVAYKNYEFGTLKVERKTVGKQIEQQRQKLKIYNKGRQYNLKDKNLSRFEVAIKKMESLKPYNIKTLSDLTEISKITPLLGILLNWWRDIIYYDKSINIKALSPKQQKRVLYSATPRNWVEFNRMQRARAKKRFNELMSLHGSKTQKEIAFLIAEKWEQLTAKKCIRFNRPTNEIIQQQNVYELTVRIHGYNVYKTTLKENNQKSLKTTTKKSSKKRRVCVVCKSSILHKKAGAKYCSKKCNNKQNGMKRTQKRKKRIGTEKQQLKKLLNLLPKNKLELLITYKTIHGIYSDQLQQKEINTSADWIKKVQRVLVSEYRKNALPILLTSYRARNLINEINNLNSLKK